MLKKTLLAFALFAGALTAAHADYQYRVTAKGISAAAPGATPPSSTGTTTLLLHFDGALTDSSASGKWVTTTGTASTAGSPRFGSGALLVTGTSSGLYVQGSTDFAFPAGTDFTLEAQVYSTANEAVKQILGQWSSPNSWQFSLLNGRLGLTGPADNWAALASSPISLNAWHHVAAARQGSTLRLFVDGVVVATVTDTVNYTFDTSVPLGVGKAAGQVGYAFVNGQIDEVRITKGEARYTGNFTPPSVAFTQ